MNRSPSSRAVRAAQARHAEPAEPPTLVPLTEAARRLGLALSTLQHQARAGRIRAWKLGRDWVTTEAEVERYRREQRGQPGMRKPRGV